MAKQKPGQTPINSETDINEVVRIASGGDERAFEEIVRRYEKQVYNAALYMAKNREDAMDISQEVFVKLWNALPTFRGESAFGTWLARITRNTALDYLRTNREEPLSLTATDEDGEENEILIPDQSVDADPVRSFDRKEKVQLVREAIAALPAPSREVIILREIHQLSYTEIANTLGLEEGTVKSRINRAKKIIKKFLISRNFFE